MDTFRARFLTSIQALAMSRCGSLGSLAQVFFDQVSGYGFQSVEIGEGIQLMRVQEFPHPFAFQNVGYTVQDSGEIDFDPYREESVTTYLDVYHGLYTYGYRFYLLDNRQSVYVRIT